MRVLVTRAAADAERTARALRAAGHEALIAPVSQIARIESPAPQGPFGGVIATSANALAHAPAALIERLAGKATLFAVGRQTAEAARALGFDVVAAQGGDAADLAEAILAHPARSPLLYLAGEPRKPALEEKLAAAGRDLTVFIVYRSSAASCLTEPAAEALRTGRIDAILHFSRESATRFATLCETAGLTDEARRRLHVCLSADVAAGLDSLAPERLAIAAKPSEAALFILLDEGH